MSIFDPTAVNKTLDAYLATIPPGKKVMLLATADLKTRKLSFGAAVKLGDVVTAYAGFSKTPGADWAGEVGAKASFLFGTGADAYEFDASDIVAVLRARGYSWPAAVWKVAKLRVWGEVEL